MLGRLFSEPARVAAPSNLTGWGDWNVGNVTASGEVVNTDTATQMLAVYGSVTLICEQIATMPLDVYRRTVDGAPQEVTKPRWLQMPTVDLTFVEWCTQVLWSLLMVGNAYVAVFRSGDTIVELVPLDPELVRVRRSTTGRPVYFVNGNEYRGELLHIRGVMRAGALEGLSPLEAARQSIGLGLAAQNYGANFFAADGNMPGVIELPRPAQAETMKQMAEAWRRRRAKGGKGLPGVLDDGATWKPTGVTNEQAQFLATRQWSAAEIAGQVYKIDPSDLGIPVSGSTLTYANAQDRKRHRYELGLSPWVRRVEDALSGLLAAPRYVKFNMDAYLRGDTAQRFSVYEVAERINASAANRGEPPLLTTEEMRDLEDMAPIVAEGVRDGSVSAA